MAKYQSMLVVIDPNQDDQPALRRAVYLHQRIGGRIKAFLPIYDFSYEMTTLLSPDERTAMRQGVIAQRTAWIREQAKFYLESGVPIDVKVVWHNRPFEAIIQEVVSEKHDLLLKMAHQHDKLEAVIFTPTDWHLLRKCPCPVWMVKDQPWPEGGKALVAVNLASEENYHNTLNEKLVRETLSLAEEVNHTEVHLIGAYPVTPINIAIELPDFDPSVYNDAIRGQHLLAMKALRQKFGIDEKFTHVEKGLPEEVIPDLAEHLQAGIVVLGTVGRTGLSAAFLGNTAEQVEALRRNGYKPREFYEQDPELHQALTQIGTGLFSPSEPGRYRDLLDSLINFGDHYQVLADYRSYVDCQDKVDELYRHPEEWAMTAMHNIANMGYFSSDRTIQEYADHIWHIDPVRL